MAILPNSVHSSHALLPPISTRLALPLPIPSLLMRPVVFQALIYSLLSLSLRRGRPRRPSPCPAPEEKAEIRWSCADQAWPGFPAFPSSITSRALIFPSRSRHHPGWLWNSYFLVRLTAPPVSHGLFDFVFPLFSGRCQP